MQESEKHIRAFEAYYASRNLQKVSAELQISRQSLSKWKREFNWKLRCKERDNEIKEQVQAVMMPQWAATRTLLIQTFLNQINAATKAEISPENSRDMVAISKELRALLGEPDRHEIITTTQHKLTDDPDIMAAENDLLKLIAKKESDA